MLPKVVLSLTLALLLAPQAMAAQSFQTLKGFNEPDMPAKYDKVGILKFGKPKGEERARPEPGHVGRARRTSRRSPGDRRGPLPRLADLGRRAPREPARGPLRRSTWRRRATAGASAGCSTTTSASSTDRASPTHFHLHQGRRRGRTRKNWGHAGWRSRICTAWCRPPAKGRAATWWLAATRSAARSPPPTRPGTSTASPGVKGLAGLVFIDGGSGDRGVSKEDAEASSEGAGRDGTSPWLNFGGIPAPFAGLFNIVGAQLVKRWSPTRRRSL